MTRKQEVFVTEYMKDFNGTRAAIAAGYSEKTAPQIASRLKKDPLVKEAIQAEFEKIKKGNQEDVYQIYQELRKIAFFNMKDIASWETRNNIWRNEDGDIEAVETVQQVSLKDSDEIDGSLVQEVTEVHLPSGGKKVSIKAHDKMKALDLLGKYHAMFTDKVDVSGDLKQTVIVVDLPEDMQTEVTNDERG